MTFQVREILETLRDRYYHEEARALQEGDDTGVTGWIAGLYILTGPIRGAAAAGLLGELEQQQPELVEAARIGARALGLQGTQLEATGQAQAQAIGEDELPGAADNEEDVWLV